MEIGFFMLGEAKYRKKKKTHIGKSIMYICVHCVLSNSNHVWFAIPWTVAHQAPLSLGILQARILDGVVMPSSRGSYQARDQTQVSCIAGRFFTIWATREAHNVHLGLPLTLDDFCVKCTWCRFATPQRDSGFGHAALDYWYVYLAFGNYKKVAILILTLLFFARCCWEQLPSKM